ncbi:MAG: hypothetical protein LBU64_05710 [Planctomycetota bacterium]|jgi:hypothetical protein|nr:hypothetical protein [Planctomycetota bacterium]
MREFIDYHRQLSFWMIGTSLAAGLVLLLAARPDYSLAGGFALGAGAQIFKFGILDLRLVLALAAGAGRPAGTQLRLWFFSLAVFALAAGAALKTGANLWALAAGVFLPRLLLLADAWLRPDVFGSGAGPENPEEAGRNPHD